MPVLCTTDTSNRAGTGFATARGIVSALHVVAGCANGAAVSLGGRSANLVATDPAHDLALLHESGFGPGEGPPRLGIETRRPKVGESLALLGFPGDRGELRVLNGTIIGVDRSAALSSREGLHERLNDVISVDVEGLAPGESGGPAIDSSGKVVGVVEAGGRGFAYLTPVRDLPSARHP